MIVEAGVIHGIIPSTVFAIFSDHAPSCENAQLGLLRVARNGLGKMTSILSFVSDSRQFFIPHQFYAKQIPDTKIRIFCESAKLDDVLRGIPNSERLDIVREGRETDASIRVSFDNDRMSFFRTNRMQDIIASRLGSPLPFRLLASAPHHLLAVLRAMARFDSHLDRQGRLNLSSVISAEMRCQSANRRAYGSNVLVSSPCRITVLDDDISSLMCLRITNLEDYDLFVHVLYFNSSTVSIGEL